MNKDWYFSFFAQQINQFFANCAEINIKAMWKRSLSLILKKFCIVLQNLAMS
jgi:hypothetical protein